MNTVLKIRLLFPKEILQQNFGCFMGRLDTTSLIKQP